MASIDIMCEQSITLRCHECGNEISGDLSTKRNDFVISVELCTSCKSDLEKEIEELKSRVSELEDELAVSNETIDIKNAFIAVQFNK